MLPSKAKKNPYSTIKTSPGPKITISTIELRNVLIGALCIAIAVSLFSYSPKDPSLSTWSSSREMSNWMGRFGSILADILFQLFGLSAFFIVALLALSCTLAKIQSVGKGGILFLISSSILFQSLLDKHRLPKNIPNAGGLLGKLFCGVSHFGLGTFGTLLLGVSGILVANIILFEWQLTKTIKRFIQYLRATLARAVASCREAFAQKRQTAKESAREQSLISTPRTIEISPANSRATTSLGTVSESLITPPVKIAAKPKAKRVSHRDFELPGINLLSGKAENKSKTVDKSWYLEKGAILVQKLKDFGVEGEIVNICPGPVITVYEFKPASGVKIKEIANLSDDLTLALSALSVRIVAPIPGKPVVGIEIPSPQREMVFFKDLLQETPFYEGEVKIPILLGRMASGEPLAADLASMPHLLIAGSTGTGKSVFINTLISSLLFRFTPKELKLILVDPKMVELSSYEGIPHLLLPVVVDSKKAVMALRWTVDEMERRYTLMHQYGVRHIDAYNARIQQLQDEKVETETDVIPYIVVVIDEYADLMAVVPKEVELSIARLAQKARASGIHLVLATQRPSTDVVTGTIKANFPSRISFRVASSIDSKTILDRTGSERLLGHGDLLFHSAGFSTLKRMQGPFLSDADLEKVVDFLKEQGEPEYDERIMRAAEEGEIPPSESTDNAPESRLYDAAVALVTEKGEASISLIQRHLKIGYNRAASLMEQMEKEGVVGQSTGAAKRRSVLVGPH